MPEFEEKIVITVDTRAAEKAIKKLRDQVRGLRMGATARVGGGVLGGGGGGGGGGGARAVATAAKSGGGAAGAIKLLLAPLLKILAVLTLLKLVVEAIQIIFLPVAEIIGRIFGALEAKKTATEEAASLAATAARLGTPLPAGQLNQLAGFRAENETVAAGAANRARASVTPSVLAGIARAAPGVRPLGR